MLEHFIDEFQSPFTKHRYQVEVYEKVNNRIKTGKLIDLNGKDIPIINFIPRFVEINNYTDSFGKQWNMFKKIQLDSYNKTKITHERFFTGTEWKPEEMRNQRILEAGCGGGRFTEILLGVGTRVYSFDYSNAVDVCYENNSHNNLCLFQGNIYTVPFKENYFDRVFCYGVLQHTPDPKGAFLNLVKYLKKGGKISIDVYLKDGKIYPSKAKYIWRPLTTKIKHKTLFKIIKWYVPKWLSLDTFLKKIPYIGRLMVIVTCWNYYFFPLLRGLK